MYYSVFWTDCGYAAVVADDRGIVRFYLPGQKNNVIVNTIKEEYAGIEEKDNNIIKEAKELLIKYFRGEEVVFKKIPLNMDRLTEFTRKVLSLTNRIPYGQVRTYKWVAGELNDRKKARAVGSVLNKNPLPVIIPCHRIIKSGGEIGGFGSGVEWKMKLLKLEKVLK